MTTKLGEFGPMGVPPDVGGVMVDRLAKLRRAELALGRVMDKPVVSYTCSAGETAHTQPLQGGFVAAVAAWEECVREAKQVISVYMQLTRN